MLSSGGAATRLRDQAQPEAGDLASPAATRQRRRRWRDPRLWFGVLMVLGSVVLGARVVAAMDDTVAVWQVAHDLPAGSTVNRSDLRLTDVHFDESSAAAPYLTSDQPIPAGARAARDLQAGELLDSSALGAATTAASRQLPLGVGPAHAPSDLRPGDHVDVWAVPPADATGPAAAVPVVALHDVVVVSVSGDASSLSAQRQVLVGLAPSVDVGSVLRRTADAEVVLVRLAG